MVSILWLYSVWSIRTTPRPLSGLLITTNRSLARERRIWVTFWCCSLHILSSTCALLENVFAVQTFTSFHHVTFLSRRKVAANEDPFNVKNRRSFLEASRMSEFRHVLNKDISLPYRSHFFWAFSRRKNKKRSSTRQRLSTLNASTITGRRHKSVENDQNGSSE